MDYRELWAETLEKYSTIKEMYIKCEETDPELDTNLQPLNEFRAALDHIMKASMIMCQEDDNEECERRVKDQFVKLNSHLNRAFYDICDMLSINYRNKIIDILENYDYDTISVALPEYYVNWKIKIEKISDRIAAYRFNKGTSKEDTDRSYAMYKEDIMELKEIYVSIRDRIPSLNEIKVSKMQEAATIERKDKKGTIIGVVGIIVGLLGVVIGIII